MREIIQSRKLTGAINVACKYDDGSVRYWSTDKETIISRIVQIVSEYRQQGYVLTLRQLHYQLVSNNWIVNHDTAYKKLGNILDDCRYAGIIDWDDIEDRGRRPYLPYSVDNLAEALEQLRGYYRLDRQHGQPVYLELWTEKDALSGILKKTTEKYHIQLVVNKGYTSSSAIYGAYKRIAPHILAGRQVRILYFGDHDPSGLDMVRDINDRLRMFLKNGTSIKENQIIQDWWDAMKFDVYDLEDEGYITNKERWALLNGDVEDNLGGLFDAAITAKYITDFKLFEVVPIGLTMEQIKKYDLPHNPAKLTDSRAAEYVKKYGKISWEVDALKPNVLTEIVEHEITSRIDHAMYNTMLSMEYADKEKITKIAEEHAE